MRALALEDWTPELEARVLQEMQWGRAAHEAVRKGLPLYLRLLDHLDPAIRTGATSLLGRFPEDNPRCAEALKRRLAGEENQWVRVRINRSLAALLSDAALRRDHLIQALRSEPAYGARLQLAMAILEEYHDDTPSDAVSLLIEAIPDIAQAQLTIDQTRLGTPQVRLIASSTSSDEEAMGTNDAARTPAFEPPPTVLELASDLLRFNAVSALYPNLHQVSNELRTVARERVEQALPALLSAFTAADASQSPFFVLESLAKTLVYVAFGDEHLPTGTRAQALAAEQREVLRAINGSDSLRRRSWNIQSILRPLGVPLDRTELQRYETS